MTTTLHHMIRSCSGITCRYPGIVVDSLERRNEHITINQIARFDKMSTRPALPRRLEQTAKDLMESTHACLQKCTCMHNLSLGLVLVQHHITKSAIIHVHVASYAWNLVWSCGLIRNIHAALCEVFYCRERPVTGSQASATTYGHQSSRLNACLVLHELTVSLPTSRKDQGNQKPQDVKYFRTIEEVFIRYLSKLDICDAVIYRRSLDTWL